MSNLHEWLWAIAFAIMGFILFGIAAYANAEMRYFAVTAYNDWGESNYSDELVVDIPNGTGATLQWNSVPTATGYKVYWGKSTQDYFPALDTGTETSYTFVKTPPPTGANITVIP